MPQILTFIFLCIVWGTTWIAIKVSLEGLSPFFSASLRFAVALIFLILYVRWKGISLRIRQKDMLPLLVSAFLMYIFDYGLIYWGEQYLSAGVTSIFFATFVLFTALWTNFLFRSERFAINKFTGLLIGFAGIVTVFYDQLLLTDFNRMVIFGSLAIIIGAAGGAMSVVIVKKYLYKMNPIALSFHQMFIGVVFLALFGFMAENPAHLHFNMRIFIAVLYLGAVGSALAFALYYWLLQTTSAITLSLIIYITPIVAVIGDYFFYGETLHIRTFIGMTIIFAGIAVTQTEIRKLQRLVLKRVLGSNTESH